MLNIPALLCLDEVIERLFNVKLEIFQLYYGKNQLLLMR